MKTGKHEVIFPFLFVCQVSEMAVSELPGNPNAVWTVRRHIEGNGVHVPHTFSSTAYKPVRSLIVRIKCVGKRGAQQSLQSGTAAQNCSDVSLIESTDVNL